MRPQPLPGNPTPAQLAAADQRHADVRATVDRLVTAARAGQPGSDTETWITFCVEEMPYAAATLAGQKHDLGMAAFGIAAEAILRLARTDQPR